MNAFNTGTPALILRLGKDVYHHGSLGIARSLGRVGVPVYGTFEDRLVPAGFSRYVRGGFVRSVSIEVEAVLQDLATIGSQIGRRSVLIPSGDFGAILVAEHASALEQWFMFPRPPPDLPGRLADKKRLHGLCRALGVDAPESHFPETKEQLSEALETAKYPIVVKVLEPWSLGIASSPPKVVRSAQEFVASFDAIPPPNIMIQEYIPRSDSEDWFYGGYCDAKSRPLAGFTGRKFRSYPAFAGFTTLALACENEDLRERAEGLLKAISYQGLMDLCYRLDLRDGRYKLLDFNPRIGANFRAMQDGSGMDVVRALHLDMTGREVVSSRWTSTRKFLVENYDLVSGPRYIRAGELTWIAWIKGMRSADERAWMSRDDLVPFVVMAVRFALHVVLRVFGIRNAGATGPRPVRGWRRRQPR